ncbi:MAG: peptidylprolyl isomerase [Candidatus Paceibacterota bacterium]
MNKTILFTIIIIALAAGSLFVFMSMPEDEPANVEEEKDEYSESQEEDTSDITINPEDIHMKQATLKTSKGDITLEFYPELAPKTVKNFQELAESGFYDGVIFHRVIEGFMIQGGDPTGTGTGGPGYTFEDELDPSSEIAQKGYRRGTLAMANRGPNTNGSQFFIMHKDYPLPYDYTIFGKVIDGMDIVDAIATVETGQNDKPSEEITIDKVEVLD